MELQETAQDFHLKYSECVGFLTHKDGSDEMYMVEDVKTVHGEPQELRGYVAKNGKWCARTYKLKDIESLDFPMPELGFVNHDKLVVNVVRSPEKQYRRGFTTSRGVITSRVVEEYISMHHNLPSFRAGVPFIQDVFDPKYFSPEHALAELESKKRVAAAVTNRYYIAVSHKLPYVYLGFGNEYVIGRVNEQNGKITLFNSARPLYEDLSNYFTIRN